MFDIYFVLLASNIYVIVYRYIKCIVILFKTNFDFLFKLVFFACIYFLNYNFFFLIIFWF